MKVYQVVNTKPKPIGIAMDPVRNTIWVACYEGYIMVFDDTCYRLEDPENCKIRAITPPPVR